MVTMVTAGVESKGHVANLATTDVSFRDGFLAVTNIIFAYRKFTPYCNRIMLQRWIELINCSRPYCLLWLHV